MPIDSIAGLRHLSQAQGSFVRLDQSTDKLQTTTAKARFWQLSQRSQEKAGNRAAAERVRDSDCAYCGKAEGTRLFNQYIGKKSLEGKAFTGGNLSRLLDAAAERNLACLGRGMVATGRRALRPELMAELGRAGVDPDYFVSLVSQGVWWGTISGGSSPLPRASGSLPRSPGRWTPCAGIWTPSRRACPQARRAWPGCSIVWKGSRHSWIPSGTS